MSRCCRNADDRGVLLVDAHPLSRAEHVDGDALELDAEVLGDDLAAGQDGDVLEHGFAPIAEAWRFDRRYLEPATQLVHHQCGQGLALDILGDDQQRPPDWTIDSRIGNIA